MLPSLSRNQAPRVARAPLQAYPPSVKAMPPSVVRPGYRDHGVAAELIAKALDDIRASGKKVTVICGAT